MFERVMNRRRFRKAKSAADDVGGSVSAVKGADGRWLYFVVPSDATDAEVRAKAFELREGRPMSRLERQLNMIAGGEPT